MTHLSVGCGGGLKVTRQMYDSQLVKSPAVSASPRTLLSAQFLFINSWPHYYSKHELMKEKGKNRNIKEKGNICSIQQSSGQWLCSEASVTSFIPWASACGALALGGIILRDGQWD